MKAAPGAFCNHWKQIFSVLLINPSPGPPPNTREDRLRTYLSLGTLASALQDKVFIKNFARTSGRFSEIGEPLLDRLSFKVWILDLALKQGNQGLQEYFESFIQRSEFRPDLIGMTATSSQLDEARELADIAAHLFPDALRVIGGPHVSVAPFDFLKKTRFQAACVGEGVETLVDLILAFMARGIRGSGSVSGIALKDDAGEICLNPPRQPLFPLDDYPFPSGSLGLFVDDIDDVGKNGRDLVYILAGAGCPYRCIFCAQYAIHKGTIRERSAENIFAEMKSLSAKGFRRFALVQETFLRDAERVARFCALIESSGLPLEWTVEARADQLDFDRLTRMKKAGLRFVQLGVESGDQVLLETLGKKIHLREVVRARDGCAELGIDTAFYMLVGLPGQDWQSILRSAIFLKKHLPVNRITRHISTAVAIPYPGTRIYEEKSVRLTDMPALSLNWPERHCSIVADEEGVFIGKNYTETDAMISSEILEAYTFLDDFGYFLLHANYNPDFSLEERLRARDFAYRLFYMIARRTIRDLILKARSDLTPAKYRQAHAEILARDQMAEAQLKDVTPSTELWPGIFFLFLATVRFQNGFQTLKALSVPERIQWMKLCGVLWAEGNNNFSRIHFDSDEEDQGQILSTLLESISSSRLNLLLENAERGVKNFDFPQESGLIGNSFVFLGIPFEYDQADSVLNVKRFVADGPLYI